jgi:membrane-bound lytic murein transglycosylase
MEKVKLSSIIEKSETKLNLLHYKPRLRRGKKSDESRLVRCVLVAAILKKAEQTLRCYIADLIDVSSDAVESDKVNVAKYDDVFYGFGIEDDEEKQTNSGENNQQKQTGSEENGEQKQTNSGENNQHKHTNNDQNSRQKQNNNDEKNQQKQINNDKNRQKQTDNEENSKHKQTSYDENSQLNKETFIVHKCQQNSETNSEIDVTSDEESKELSRLGKDNALNLKIMANPNPLFKVIATVRQIMLRSNIID